ncbi:MAG: cytochrome c [Bacteroidetes bacterium]|nr:MAG: cytochrome c [Bacteroidota bacterium]
MMKYSKINIHLGLASLALLALASCGVSDANSPGVEYMPDMYRSPSIEPYVDYENPDQMSARLPVEGTIVFTDNADEEMYNYPYAYDNSFEGYELSAENVGPIPMNENTVAEGKKIYKNFCVHCHGKTGQGDGAIPTKADYPPPPAYNGNALKELPEGKMYHTLTFGKGMMGSHASQLSAKDRWIVIQYVKYLQNGESMTKPAEELPEQ